MRTTTLLILVPALVVLCLAAVPALMDGRTERAEDRVEILSEERWVALLEELEPMFAPDVLLGDRGLTPRLSEALAARDVDPRAFLATNHVRRERIAWEEAVAEPAVSLDDALRRFDLPEGVGVPLPAARPDVEPPGHRERDVVGRLLEKQRLSRRSRR